MSQSFFDQVDGLFRPDRGPNGEPSATDFLVIDLPPIVDQLATGFESLAEIEEGVPSARMIVGAGRLVARFVVFALELPDNSIEVIGIDVDEAG